MIGWMIIVFVVCTLIGVWAGTHLGEWVGAWHRRPLPDGAPKTHDYNCYWHLWQYRESMGARYYQCQRCAKYKLVDTHAGGLLVPSEYSSTLIDSATRR